MNQKRLVFIILGMLIGAGLGAWGSETINNMGLYSGLGAVVGVCLGWLVATAVHQWQKKQY